MNQGTSMKKKKKEKEGGGFFARLFGTGVEGSRRRTFRILKKELSSVKMDVYKLKQDAISVSFARALFEIYKLTYPLRLLIHLEKGENRLPYYFMESLILYHQSRDAREIYDKMNEESIHKLAVEDGVKKTVDYIEKISNEYFTAFDEGIIGKINIYYTNFLHFIRFAHFDFFPILREFDNSLEEANFLDKPSFNPVDGTLLKDDLLKLHLALHRFTVGESIDQGIEIIAKLKNTEPMSKSSIQRLKRLLREFQENGYVSLIIRAIDMNTAPIPIRKPTTVDIFHSFSVKKKKDIRTFLHSVKAKHRNQAISSVVTQLFDGDPTESLKNYNEPRNEQFVEHGLPVFEHAAALNYTKAFASDRYSTFIKEVINELIITGSFNNKTVLNNLSNSYYALNNLIGRIEDFDDDLDVDGENGNKIHRFIKTVNKDKSSRNLLDKTIRNLNKRATVLVHEEIVHAKEMAYILKKILEEYKANTQNIVYNIKKIRTHKNKEFIQDLVSCYKYIYLYLKLISSYVSLQISKEEIEREKAEQTDRH
jgi:hypothetical protein